MSASKWNKITISIILAVLILVAGVIVVVDPFWHYHLSVMGLQYPLKVNDERYLNDGIARYYDYDAIITGSSMTSNFKASEMDELWDCTCIKIPSPGASIHESNSELERAFSYNSGVRYVIKSLDVTVLDMGADENIYPEYPEFMYDHNLFNDVKYVLNKEILLKAVAVINYTRSGNKTTSLDEYGSFDQYKGHGREAVFESWTRQDLMDEVVDLSGTDIATIQNNVWRNALQIAYEHPEIQFYYFFPPYSICYWDDQVRTGRLDADIQTRMITAGMLLQADNIHLFEFSDDIDMISNLDNYSDSLHYGAWINSDILTWMSKGRGELTKETYENYYSELKEQLQIYDYDAVLE